MQVIIEKCKGCGTCVLDCPQGAITLSKKIAVIGDACSQCGACLKVCPEEALFSEDAPSPLAATCEACPICCRIKEGYTGACQRFMNRGGVLERTIALKTYEEVKHLVGPDWKPAIRQPLITGIGAGTTYPDCKPAPHIVQSKVDGVDVVTVVTEAPLSYSGIKLKVDTDSTIGQEGAGIFFRKKKVGHLTTEEYGSKILSIGGANLLTSSDGMTVARLVSDLANRKSVRLRIEAGSRLELQVGNRPTIDGTVDDVMRVGCGSATLGLFANIFKEVADEVIVLDSHLTGLMSEHAAGLYVGARPSGVNLRFKRSTPGRYLGDHGQGWGGTSILDPKDVIESIDMKVAKPGMTILITETTGRKASAARVESGRSPGRDSHDPGGTESCGRTSRHLPGIQGLGNILWRLRRKRAGRRDTIPHKAYAGSALYAGALDRGRRAHVRAAWRRNKLYGGCGKSHARCIHLGSHSCYGVPDRVHHDPGRFP